MIISCVLRKSLAFGPEHVEWLGRQVAKVYPEAEFLPFSDVPLSIPHERLHEGLPTWWSKMEAYRRLPDDLVMMLDLDMVWLKRLPELPVLPDGEAYMQTSPRDIDKVWGAFLLSTPGFRRAVVEHFYADVEGNMLACNGCDQKYYRDNFLHLINPMNVAAPDAIISYKLHYLQQGFTDQTAMVVFHGFPRPWQTEEPWVPPLFSSSEI
jgi:hypothetical protein